MESFKTLELYFSLDAIQTLGKINQYFYFTMGHFLEACLSKYVVIELKVQRKQRVFFAVALWALYVSLLSSTLHLQSLMIIYFTGQGPKPRTPTENCPRQRLKSLIWNGLTFVTESENILTSLADEPETSIQVLEKNAQEPSMKMMYMTACMGSSMMWPTVSGGDM